MEIVVILLTIYAFVGMSPCLVLSILTNEYRQIINCSLPFLSQVVLSVPFLSTGQAIK